MDMLEFYSYGLSLNSDNLTICNIIYDMIDNSFISYWKQNQKTSEILETDIIEYYMSKDSITEKQYELLKQYYDYYNSQRNPECDAVILAVKHNAVNAIVKNLKSHLNAYSKEFLLTDILDELNIECC